MKINMLSTAQAAARLGVKPQTLYAYVSRGILTRSVAADGGSLFRAGEVEALARRGRPRAGRSPHGALELALRSAVTELRPDALRYRGHDACALSTRHGFESVAELLWTGQLVPDVRWPSEAAAPRRRGAAGSAPLERYVCALADLAADDPLRIDLDPAHVAALGRRIVLTLLASLPLPGASPPTTAKRARAQSAAHTESVAARLWPRLSPLPAQPARVAMIDAALVLLADHELATSTLAARVAASTRAHPFAVVAAGLAALSGPLHGKAAERVQRVLRAALHSTPPELAWAEAHGEARIVPGFGHPVYVRGDVRAEALLARLLPLAKPRPRTIIEALRRHGTERTGLAPNADFALGALAFAFDMPLGATSAVFALARCAGFIAHALEEYGEAPLRFRARALYVGR